MPEISLRAYTKQIDELIERERLDEAIAHCRHILQTYPKHLETYRHLGKAYLEAKRYGDAADIFQRVLSAAPDDFVSHIGMAIVREDEGNLDAAIWHMERAFETNPANPAIQQEMKRLIGKRDGLEPHKVRLTRGALARMYAHGELYPQAIAELRSALQEDSERPDLQVLLADIYWQTGQKAEATALANRILEKLPYCLTANRILAAGLQADQRVEEAAVFHRRIAGLDAYAAFVESAMADAKVVEASAVMLEKLDWHPGEPQPASRQPGWATTLGYEMQRLQSEESQRPAQTGPLPPWLEPGEPRPFEPKAEAELREEVDRTEELSGADGEEPPAARMPVHEEAGGAAPAEPVPDWDAESASEPGPAPAWMNEIEAPVMPAEPTPEGESTIPDWMQEAGWGESTGQAVDRPVSFSDEELGALEAGVLPPEGASEPQTVEAEPPGGLAPAELPDWIHDIAPSDGQEVETGQELEEAPLPSWLDDESGGSDRTAQPPRAAARPEAELPSEPTFPKAEADGKDLPTWITEESPGATETIVTWLGGRSAEPAPPAEEAKEDLPTWMRDTGPLEEGLFTDETPPSGIGRDRPAAAAPETPALPPEMPGWLSAVADAAAREELPPTPDLEPPTPPAPEALPTSQVPDWLSAAMEDREAGVEPGALSAGPIGEPTLDQPPDWMAGMDEVDEGQPEAPVAQAAEHIPDESFSGLGTPGAAAEVETPDWLRGLAEEGMDATASLGGRGPGAPDWLREIAEPGSVSGPAGEELAEGSAAAPDWLEGLGEEEPEPGPSAASGPDWLEGMAEEPAAPAGRGPDWLEGLAEEPEPTSPEEISAPAVAAWEPPVEATPEPEPVEEDDAVLTWLEGLAARQAEATEAEAPRPEAPVEPIFQPRAIPEEPEEGLEWLEQLAEQRGLDVDVTLPAGPGRSAPPATPAPEPEEEPEPSALDTAPDWLTRMATQRLPTVDLPAEPPPAAPPQDVWREIDWAGEEPARAEPIMARPPEPVEVRTPPPAPPAPTPEPDTASAEPAPDEDEVPDWLLEAAGQAEPSPTAPTLPAGLPPEFAAAPAEAPPAQPAAVVPAAPPEPIPTQPRVAPPVPTSPAVPIAPEPVPISSTPIAPPAAPPAPAPTPPAAPSRVKLDPAKALDDSRQALATGDVAAAAKLYGALLKRRDSVDQVIEDLRVALERSPDVAVLWQILGDAYMRVDRTGEALEAYRRGMEAG